MKAPRRLLLLAVFVLALGVFLLVGGAKGETNWAAYLGLTCVLLTVCVAALIEALQSQHKRIAELEQNNSRAK